MAGLSTQGMTGIGRLAKNPGYPDIAALFSE
jgi:hypothetical protein